MLPVGVTVHAHRIYSREKFPVENEEKFDAVNAGLAEFTEVLARAEPAVIAYGITTGSFYRGIAHARSLTQIIESHSKAKAVLPSLAILEALAALKAKTISVLTPYPRWNNQVLLQFLEQTPFKVLNLKGDDRPLEVAEKSWMWHQEPAEIVEFVRKHFDPEADVIVCPCTAWRSFEVVSEIESLTRKPVVTANQATIWKTFDLLGLCVNSNRGGSLFQYHA